MISIKKLILRNRPKVQTIHLQGTKLEINFQTKSLYLQRNLKKKSELIE